MRRTRIGVGGLVWVGVLVARLAGAEPVEDEARCAILKLKTVVKELKDKAQCYERSVKGRVPVAQACMQRAEEKSERLLARVEESGQCETAKDRTALSSRIDTFLRDVTVSLQGRSSSAPAAPPAAPTAAGSASGSLAAPVATPAAAATAAPSPKE